MSAEQEPVEEPVDVVLTRLQRRWIICESILLMFHKLSGDLWR